MIESKRFVRRPFKSREFVSQNPSADGAVYAHAGVASFISVVVYFKFQTTTAGPDTGSASARLFRKRIDSYRRPLR